MVKSIENHLPGEEINKNGHIGSEAADDDCILPIGGEIIGHQSNHGGVEELHSISGYFDFSLNLSFDQVLLFLFFLFFVLLNFFSVAFPTFCPFYK